MEFVYVVLLIALLQYLALGLVVGYSRRVYGIPAPAISGHPIFERYFRAHQNTLEMLIAFVPGLFLFAHYVDVGWAAWIGVVYLVGRTIYVVTYIRDPATRAVGFALTVLPILTLLIGALLAAGQRAFGI